MTNYEKYVEAFKTGLGIDEDKVTKELTYQSVMEWDSVGHMELVAELEDAFNISMDTDDIVDFNSFEAGIKILEKYNIKIEE